MLGRRAALMGLLVTLLATPVATMPPGVGAEDARTLVDLTIETVPQRDGGHCFQTSTGHVTASVHAVGAGTWPVRYTLGPWGNAAEGERVNTLIATQPTTHSIAVQDGLYCYTLSNEAVPATRRLFPDEVYTYAQDVALTMTWTP